MKFNRNNVNSFVHENQQSFMFASSVIIIPSIWVVSLMIFKNLNLYRIFSITILLIIDIISTIVLILYIRHKTLFYQNFSRLLIMLSLSIIFFFLSYNLFFENWKTDLKYWLFFVIILMLIIYIVYIIAKTFSKISKDYYSNKKKDVEKEKIIGTLFAGLSYPIIKLFMNNLETSDRTDIIVIILSICAFQLMNASIIESIRVYLQKVYKIDEIVKIEDK